jgi:putative NADH-flavin reductase
MAFHTVCLIGASGNLGTLILKHLLASPQQFQVKIVSRESSTATFPDSIPVTRVPDDYPAEQLTQAFRGVDVVVAAVSMLGMGEQYKFIDACLAANVKRYFPTEFGLDDLPDWLLQLREMFKIKHDVRDYLIAKQGTGLEWTSVCCNAFFEMGVASGFFQLHWKEKKAVLLDGGEAKFVATTLDTVAVAVVRAIERPEVSRNRILLVQDFRTSQRQILDAVQERVPGWEIENVESGPWLESGKEAVRKGDNSQLPKLTFGTFAQGNQYEGRAEYANDVLELPTKSFSEAMDMFWKEYKDLANA